jgi:hypothetical protein
MDKKSKAKVKVEDIETVQKTFREEFPNIVVTAAENTKLKVIRLEVRASSEADIKGIPEEYKGYPVNSMLVSEKRLGMFRELAEGTYSRD